MCRTIIFCISSVMLYTIAFAQEKVAESQSIAIVDSEQISAAQLSLALKNATGQDFSTQQLAQASTEELVALIESLLVRKKLLEGAYGDSVLQQRIEIGDLREQVVRAKQDVMVEAYLQQLAQFAVNAEMVQARYDELIAELHDKYEYEIHHILVDSEEDADKVIDALDANEYGFAEVARTFSMDPSVEKNSGNLGYMQLDTLKEIFAEVIASLEIDAYALPIKSESGWHIFRVTDKRPVEAAPLEAVADQIIDQLLVEARQAYINNLLIDSDIQINE